jgi:hypothetical protein
MKALKSLLSAIGLMALCCLLIFAVQKEPADADLPGETAMVNDYNVYALAVPDDLSFAGEPLPLDNPDVFEKMDRELLVNTYWQSNGLLMFKRSAKYFPIIEPILKEEGVPDDFKYLAVIESGLLNVVSPAGARGFWQIMTATGKENGLEINSNVDERYHLEKSTRVACKYLLEAKEQFGSWTLAAASYNAGKNGIAKRLEQQGVNDYYDLLLSEETGRYLYRIVALKEILSNPSKYGFNFKEYHLYRSIPTYAVKVDTAVTDFAKFARKFGINYKILKIHNPWLREPHLNNKSRKEYLIEIPEAGYYTAAP